MNSTMIMLNILTIILVVLSFVVATILCKLTRNYGMLLLTIDIFYMIPIRVLWTLNDLAVVKILSREWLGTLVVVFWAIFFPSLMLFLVDYARATNRIK